MYTSSITDSIPDQEKEEEIYRAISIGNWSPKFCYSILENERLSVAHLYSLFSVEFTIDWAVMNEWLSECNAFLFERIV
jgi:hypothetical protein